MAVIDQIHGLQVQIRVNNQPLCEYTDRHTHIADKTQERCFEAKSNAAFEIHTSFTPPFPTDRPISIMVTVDGKDVNEPLIRVEELYAPSGHVSAGPISYNGREWFTQKYRFAGLCIQECSDSPPPQDLKKRLEPIGLITCKCYFLDSVHESPERRRVESKELKKLDGVDEKAIKGEALSHQATLGATEPMVGIHLLRSIYTTGLWCTAALKDLHIIERTRDPTDLVATDDSILDQMNREQLEAAVRRLRDHEEIRLGTKCERERERSGTLTVVGDDDDDDDDDDADFIETGSIDVRKKTRNQGPGPEIEVIVLE